MQNILRSLHKYKNYTVFLLQVVVGTVLVANTSVNSEQFP
uniref:Uncharacterized protein n=1 Tax=Anguilla anguilla TaxID=7936 RepID=A0A0E9XLH4_ANGAN